MEDEGYENPTKIQKKTIPIINKGIDVIGASKSGTGKTASFVLPMLQRVNKLYNGNRVLRGLVLVPTRELADQVSLACTKYGKYLKLKHTKIIGGENKNIQIEKLSNGMDIIIATSGRLKDLILEKSIDVSSINYIVLDEADTMLEMGFLEEIKLILDNCAKRRQILMFSATISQNIRQIGKKFLQDPVVVEVSDRRDTVDLIDHRSYKVDVKRKKELLAHLIKEGDYSQILVFVNTKESADNLFEYLKTRKIDVSVIHGDIDFKERSLAIKSFRNGNKHVLIATDIAGRGIDIKDLPLVVNYELPEATDDFTHRVGRTGRANKKGEVITLLTVTDYRHFSKIERDLKLAVKREVLEGFELKDRQPRQKPFKKKKTLLEKKYKVQPKASKSGAKSKKTTKRDVNRSFGNKKNRS